MTEAANLPETQIPGSNGVPLALQIKGVSKSFGRTQALDDVSFDLARGSVHALLGGNGSGKSTLAKVLGGVEQADSGTLIVGSDTYDLRSFTPEKSRAAGIRIVHQQSSTFPTLSVAENLSLGHGFETGPGGRIRWRDVRRSAAGVLERFEIDADPDALLGTLSPAKQKMVAIARALQDREAAADGILVLDEPTAALPDAEVKVLLDAVRRYAAAGQTIIYVTHRLEEVFAVANRATLLRDARVVGDVSPKDLTHSDLVELITGRAIEPVAKRGELASGSEGEVLRLDNVAAGRLEPLSLSVQAGEVVGIAGLVGSGRSSLLKTLFGALERREGEVYLDGAPVDLSSPAAAMRAGFAYVPEDRMTDAAFVALTVMENMSIACVDRYSRYGVIQHPRERRDAEDLRSRFLVKAESVDSPLASLSGGNQQKVILARWLRRDPRVLLLDEPTQGVDVGARTDIYKFIHAAVEKGTAALVTSSDSEELALICNRVIVLRKGRLIGELTGSDLTADQIERMAHAEVEAAA